MVPNYSKELQIALEAAVKAGENIMEVYNSTESINYEKKADDSPLTIADKKSHNTIIDFLKDTDIDIISEESKSIEYQERKNWEEYWLIDPLDGTKEFIKKNGEFTVNIALIKNNKPHLGVVYCPVKKILYWNDNDKKVFKREKEETREIKKRKPINENEEGLRVVVSRSHMSEETSEYVNKLTRPELISCGSSLKFLYIADNKADIYPRFGPTMEWDTAAAHSILNALEIHVINLDTGRELSYNKENLLNPYFIIKA
ncbi:MAG: 3'(2'),5'-bisphosphate nucleotidase [Rhodothermaeota bacterium MED-G16]|nr:MAG: 3'(2'),5'-bisphosphate nucleotidase [Rhodothermaeota bacterium MED-G16]